MKLPTKEELQQLKSLETFPSVTIYCPYIEPAPGSSNPNRIQLKNQLRQAEHALAKAGVHANAIKTMLRPAMTLLSNHKTWPRDALHLVLLIEAEQFREYRVPGQAMEPLVAVGSTFVLDGLQKVVDSNKEYYLLSLSHSQPQLFKGDLYSLEQVTPKGFPTSLEESLSIDEHPRVLETHTVGPADKSRNSESFHGQYNAKQVDKNLLESFFRKINLHVHEHLRDKKHPLIIGGVEYLLPIYRQVNTYPALIEDHLTGNLERATHEDLLPRMHKILRANASS